MDVWRSSVRSALRAVSKIPRRESINVEYWHNADYAPYLHDNQNADDDDGCQDIDL